jgi:tRNA A-37 threonylcarbamoyl transferase component Bud32
MRTLSQGEWSALTQGSVILARNDHGGMTSRLADGTYLKLFRRPRLFSTARIIPPSGRFVRAAFTIAQHGIRTVRVIEGLRAPTGLRAVRYAGVEGATLRDALARTRDKSEQAAALDRLGRFIARLHEKGIYFRGLRFDNVILCDDGEFGLIDVGAARFRRAPLRSALRARNLRHLLRQDPDRTILASFGHHRFLKRYFESAGIGEPESRRIVQRLKRLEAGFREATDR